MSELDKNELIDTLEEIAADEKDAKPSLRERLLNLLGIKARDEPFPAQGFKSLGDGKWVGWYSNNFQDREDELFPNHAIDAFIARADSKSIDMPTLRYWHVPHELGKAKALARFALNDSPNAPSLIFAYGEYDDTRIARTFEKGVLRNSKQGRVYQMSHGFYYPERAKQNGEYHAFDTFELSVLPDYAAANPYTLFGDMTMPVLDDNKRKELVGILGEDLVTEFEHKADARLKELKDTGVKHKEFTLVDTEAREQLTELGKSITELTEQVKAAMKPPVDDDEEEAAKKKKADDAKKETDTAISALSKQVTDLTKEVKGFLELTPRRASKATETVVPADDPALQELAAGAAGEKSNEDKVFAGAFGWMPGVGGNK